MAKIRKVRTWVTIGVILFVSLISYPGKLPLAHGVCEAGPAPFRPYGPHIEQIQIKVYGAAIAEAADFALGAMDLPDNTAIPGCPGAADVRQSVPVGGFSSLVLNCWAGAITRPTAMANYYDYWDSQLGFNNLFTMLNMRQVLPPGCVPGAAFVPGGGNQELLRWGLQPGTGSLNVFFAKTGPELRIMRMVYDTLLEANPNDPTQLLDWMTISHAVALSGPNTVLQFHLRNDLTWQDNAAPVTANDVCQSLLAYQHVPPAFAFGAATIPLIISCTVPKPSIVLVTVAGACVAPCITYERDIGGLPIIPLRLWDSNGDGAICGAAVIGPCTGLNGDVTTAAGYDPVAIGTFAGSGPFECVIPPGFVGAGTVGGPCSRSGAGALIGQVLAAGDRLDLVRYNGYMRGPAPLQGSSYQKLSWADRNNDGVVNILDLADVAFNFGTPNPYWVNPSISPGAAVNIVGLATVAFYFGHGTTVPYAPAVVTGLDPTLDSFSVGPDYFQQCVVGAGGVAVVCQLSGIVAPAAVTVTDDFGAVINGPCAPAIPVVPGQVAFGCPLAPPAAGEIHVTMTVGGATITVEAS